MRSGFSQFRPVALAIGLALLAGCSTYAPVVDLKMSTNGGANYDTDLAECQQLASQRDPLGQTATGAGIGAVVGAGLGAALGAISGSAGAGAATGAVIGAAGGGGSSGASSVTNQRNIVINCLKGRGYAVVGR